MCVCAKQKKKKKKIRNESAARAISSGSTQRRDRGYIELLRDVLRWIRVAID